MMGDINADKCVPFVSGYSDCTEDNKCGGCTTCSCNARAEWECKKVFQCPIDEGDEDEMSDENNFTYTMDVLHSEVKKQHEMQKAKKRFVPLPPSHSSEDALIDEEPWYKEDINAYMHREKRSVSNKAEVENKSNHTVKFFNTVDELNEDTLKSTNVSGTVNIKKIAAAAVPKISRRTTLFKKSNKSGSTSLHINYNQPEEYDHHINENKIDPLTLNGNIQNNHNLNQVLGNYSQTLKDKEVSKLVVNELKSGKEIIGDKDVTPMSNITFTPENDTLTALAFIAGNLLNKLWNMEKDSKESSIEIDAMKHKKINDLLDLFKDPLSIRQEMFLKNALEKLSDTLNKNKNVKNVSVCETFDDSDVQKQDTDSDGQDVTQHIKSKNKCNENKTGKNKTEIDSGENQNTKPDIVSKLNKVLNLINKYDKIQRSLNNMKEPTEIIDIIEGLTDVDNSSFSLFGNILEKISKFLLPNNNKNIVSKIKKVTKNENLNEVKEYLLNRHNIDLGNLNITGKDKLIMDYLNHVENNPGCLFNKNSQTSEINFNSHIKGGILYNLSEFLKIKSFIDFIGLMNNENKVEVTTTSTTTEIPYITSKPSIRTSGDDKNSLQNTKDNLKLHLKAIIDDLMQLQNVNNAKGKYKSINIADVLPCIYNGLNNDRNLKNDNTAAKPVPDPMEKIEYLIESMKQEFKSFPSRRMNTVLETEVPKSAKVWERVIKNINGMIKNNRRNLNEKKPKTYEKVKQMIEQVDTHSASYKNKLLLSTVAPSEKLVLLKTLEIDAKKRANVLKNIKEIIDVILRLPLHKQREIKQFVEKSKSSIELDSKILNRISNIKGSDFSTITLDETKDTRNRDSFDFKRDLRLPLILEDSSNENKRNTKFTRQQLLNQLMINKIQTYLELQDVERTGSTVTYNVAKRILSLLKNGNDKIARELFKKFIVDKERDELMNSRNIFNVVHQNDKETLKPKRTVLLALNEPLIRFEGLKDETQPSQDHLLKQLMSLRNLS